MELRQKNIAIDAEWQDKIGGERIFLTTQIAISCDSGNIEQYLLFVNKDLYKSEIHQIEKYRDVPVNIIPWEIGKISVLEYFTKLPPKLDIYGFYSPVDCQCLYGTNNWKMLLETDSVKKMRNIYIRWNKWDYKNLSLSQRIKNCKINFIDTFGRVGCSLEEAYKTFGIDTSNGKDYIKELNIDKSQMKVFFDNNPKEFFEYSLGDLSLHLLCFNLKHYMNEIVKECYKIDDLFDSLEEYPGTIGSLVNQVFIAFIKEKYPDLMSKLNHLSTSPDSKKAIRITKILNSKRKKEEVKTQNLLEIKGICHGISGGSIPAFFPGNYDMNGRSPYGAVVHGGRAVKEDRKNNVFYNILDIDLKSAYGSSLAKFDYPIGLPTCISLSNANHREEITLKELLKKYKSDLVEGLYVIYVTGELKTVQDLIVSKYNLNTDDIGLKILGNNYEDNDDTYDCRLGGDVALTTREISLGVITSHVLKILRKVSSKEEWGDILNLSVELLVYYPKSKELSMDDWIKDPAKIPPIKTSKIEVIDPRSKTWCRFSLSEFVSPLLLERKLFQDLIKDGDTNPENRPKEKLLKLLINTLYGDLASPYFPIGNTVVANNITAKVRCLSWMMAKALGTKITVTDGGFYEYDNVNYLNKSTANLKLPAFISLFNLDTSRYIKKTKLLNEFIPHVTTQEEIDEIALNHIKNFWKSYKLDFDAEIEHKYFHSSKSAVTNPTTKVDYGLFTHFDNEIWRVRGVKDNEIDTHPKIILMRKVMEKNLTNRIDKLYKVNNLNEINNLDKLLEFSKSDNTRYHIAELTQMMGVNQYIKEIKEAKNEIEKDLLIKQKPFSNHNKQTNEVDENKSEVEKFKEIFEVNNKEILSSLNSSDSSDSSSKSYTNPSLHSSEDSPEIKYLRDVKPDNKKNRRKALPGEVIKVTFVYKPNREGSYLYETYEEYKKALHAYEMRVSRYEKKYAGCTLELVPQFKDLRDLQDLKKTKK